MHKNVVIVLIAISIIGILGIPLGDPKFIAEAVALETSYITLTILSVKDVRHALIANIAIACMVIAGNTLSPKHIDIMLALKPIYNALILITGGYILQVLLIITSALTYRSIKRVAIRDST